MQCTVIQKLTAPHGLSYSFPICGKCMACRINKRREWTGRMLLEARADPRPGAFITLTYSDDHVPPGGTLVKSHLSSWLKRFRSHVKFHHGIDRLRYFACGEYGEKFGRPHYHVILFGLDPVLVEKSACSTWNNGFVSVSELNENRMKYTARYTLKKIINRADPDYADGRISEFANMSRMPGLGAAGFDQIADELLKYGDCDTVVQGYFRTSGARYPLGRYGKERIIGRLSDFGLSSEKIEALVKYRIFEPGDPDLVVLNKLDEKDQAKKASEARAPSRTRAAYDPPSPPGVPSSPPSRTPVRG